MMDTTTLLKIDKNGNDIEVTMSVSTMHDIIHTMSAIQKCSRQLMQVAEDKFLQPMDESELKKDYARFDMQALEKFRDKIKTMKPEDIKQLLKDMDGLLEGK